MVRIEEVRAIVLDVGDSIVVVVGVGVGLAVVGAAATQNYRRIVADLPSSINAAICPSSDGPARRNTNSQTIPTMTQMIIVTSAILRRLKPPDERGARGVNCDIDMKEFYQGGSPGRYSG